MKRKLILSGILCLAVALVLIRIFSGHSAGKATAASVKDPVVPVEVYIATDTSMIYDLSTIGSLRANESVDIVGEISKKVTGVFLKEGADVGKGQLLFKLDDAEIVSRIDRLVVEEKLAMTNEARQKVQLEKGGISQEQYDATLNHLDMLKSEIAILKVDLAKTEIRAPFSGRIGLRNVSEGALVSPHMVLARLQDISRVRIDFSVPERYANDLRPGNRISFTTDYSTATFSAVIDAIEPGVDVKTRTVLLRAVCPNPGGTLVPGTSVRVSYPLRAIVKKLFIPTPALIASVKGYNVYLVRSGKALLQPVRTGIRNRQSVEITGGLELKDTVVVTNLLRIKPDSPLKIVKFN
jgi:membrane fusion protein, multidrug efflux system